MNGMQQAYSVFRKEMRTHGVLQGIIRVKLLVSPVIYLLSTHLLLGGVFAQSETGTIGPLHKETYHYTLISGFLVHAFLNHGYYFFSNRLTYEWYMGTFPLIWMTPCRRWAMALGLCAGDLFHCILLFSLGCLALSGNFTPTVSKIGIQMVLFMAVFTIGIGFGWIRSCVNIATNGAGETIDILYMGVVFGACPYVPRSLLPGYLWPFVDINPAFHLNTLILGVWTEARPSGWPAHLGAAALGLAALLFVCMVTWKLLRPAIQQETCS